MMRTFGHTSYRLEKGWGGTLSGSFRNGGGFPEQSYTESWFYYAKVRGDYNHINFSATGAPSQTLPVAINNE